MSSSDSPPPDQLARVLGTPGAVLMGLGSIVGTGIFVSIGTAAGVAGSSVLIAIAIAAVVATCNGLSSAQLAAAHPVSGGTYEYGYRYATPLFGRIAGVTFVIAKTASAATAALGFAGYGLTLLGHGDRGLQIGIAVAAAVVITLVVAGGMQRSSRLNAVIVIVTLGSLLTLIFSGAPHIDTAQLAPSGSASQIIEATALMFVAYTGYARIATLGEEVREPRRTIPRAIVIALATSMVLYISVGIVAIGVLGGDGLAVATRESSAPLVIVADDISTPVRYIVSIGAITAMLGVLLNLVLGVSRVVLAMARRGDLPRGLSVVYGSSPRRAVLVTGTVIALLALIGSVKTTWTVSAWFVLVYYAITNACALRQPAGERRFPRVVPLVGLASCCALAAWLAIRALS